MEIDLRAVVASEGSRRSGTGETKEHQEMSEAISRGTKAGMRRWYYMSVPRCSFKGCRVYLVRSDFRIVRRCAKHSTPDMACDGKGYQLKASGDPQHPIGGTVLCSNCRGSGRLAI